MAIKNDILLQFEERFKKANQEDILQLMEDMESVFKIPCLTDENFNKNNLEVMDLYLKISNKRMFY